MQVKAACFFGAAARSPRGLTCIKAGRRALRHNAGMQMRSLLLIGGLIAATAAAFVAARATPEEKVFAVSGVIRAPLDRDGRIVVAHEDIPGFMPAMTMGFGVANPSEAAALRAGDRVRFRLRVNGTSSRATDFTIGGHDAAPAPTKTASVGHGRLREGDVVPEFSLTSETNHPFTAAELRGHLTVVTFIFSRCPVPEYCPAMALRFAQLQKAILAEPKWVPRVRLLSITLDPEFDRPEILQAYGAAVGANPAVWQFATGGKDEIAKLTKSFAVYAERNGVTLDHTLCTALIDDEGRVVEIWRGNGWGAGEVMAAVSASSRGW